MELICVGDNVIDYYPQKNMLYPGGSAYNVAVLAKRYGLKTAYIGTFGNDIAGKYQIEVLEKEGIDISHIDIEKGNNARSKIINKNGQSKVVEVNKGVYRKFKLDRKNIEFISKYQHFHSTIYSYTEKYLPEIKKMGTNISFDYSFKSTDKYILNTARWVDIAFFSGVNIKNNIKKFMLDVSKFGPRCVVVTLGDKGVVALINGSYYYQTSYKVNVVDTLGAGDAFISMFLTCFINGLEPVQILKKSNKTASKSCKKYGSVGWGRHVNI